LDLWKPATGVRLPVNPQELLGSFVEHGGNLIIGTDTHNPYVYPGFSLHEELEIMAGAGLTPFEVLKTCIYNAAVCLENIDTYGTIEENKTTDLVLLKANPLEDIKNTRRIAGVIKSGIYYSRKELDDILHAVSGYYGKS